jgi:hypothetical protein
VVVAVPVCALCAILRVCFPLLGEHNSLDCRKPILCCFGSGCSAYCAEVRHHPDLGSESCSGSRPLPAGFMQWVVQQSWCTGWSLAQTFAGLICQTSQLPEAASILKSWQSYLTAWLSSCGTCSLVLECSGSRAVQGRVAAVGWPAVPAFTVAVVACLRQCNGQRRGAWVVPKPCK